MAGDPPGHDPDPFDDQRRDGWSKGRSLPVDLKADLFFNDRPAQDHLLFGGKESFGKRGVPSQEPSEPKPGQTVGLGK